MMKQLITSVFFILTFFSISNAQESTRLVTITEGSSTNASGLGQTFLGKVMSDGNLYFRGSNNGLRESIWKTDGSIQGTTKIIEEGNMFGNNWDQLFLLEDGFLINENDDWNILSAETNDFVSLPNLPAERIHSLEQVDDNSFLFTTRRDNDLILFSSNLGFDQVTEIGPFHPQGNSVLVTSGPEGAFVFNTNSFLEDYPKIYLKSTNEIMEIGDYLSTFSLTFSDLSYGYILDNFLIISYGDGDNFAKRKIINMEDNSVADFAYIWEPLDFHHYGDKFIVITQKEVISIDKSDLSYSVIFDKVFSFSSSELFDNTLMVVGRGENFSENLVKINLDENTFEYLDAGVTGSSYYNCKMKYYNNEFYYFSDDEYQLLMKYDFANNTSIVVDTLSKNTGATVVHALEVVNDELVISKRIGPLQHELYVIGDGLPNSIPDVNFIDLEVYPTISNSIITLTNRQLSAHGNSDITIIDITGQVIGVQKIVNGAIDISSLPASRYFGLIRDESDFYRIEFIKI
jgi:hypothetical protein